MLVASLHSPPSIVGCCVSVARVTVPVLLLVMADVFSGALVEAAAGAAPRAAAGAGPLVSKRLAASAVKCCTTATRHATVSVSVFTSLAIDRLVGCNCSGS